MRNPSADALRSPLSAWIARVLAGSGATLILVAAVIGSIGAHVLARGRSPVLAFGTAATLLALGVAHHALAARLSAQPRRVLASALALVGLEGLVLNGLGVARGASAPEHVALWVCADAVWLAVLVSMAIARRRS